MVILQRNHGYKYTWFVDYDKLYANHEMLYVKSMQFEKDTCLLQLSKPGIAGVEKLTIDDSVKGDVFAKENQLAFVMKPGVHVYAFTGKNSWGMQLDYVCTTQEANCLNEMLWCTLPWPDDEPLSAKTWDQSEKIFSSNDLLRGRKMLQSMAGWKQGNNDSTALMAIARICSSLQSEPVSVKPLAIEQGTVSPDSFINYVVKNKPRLNCGNYAYIIRFLSAAAGLANRSLAFKGGDEKSWSYGVHYFNEIYLAEQNKWVLADGLNNLFLPHDSCGRKLNAADVFKIMLSGGRPYGLWGFGNFHDSLQQKPLQEWYEPLKRYYANPYAMLHYEVPSKITATSSIAQKLSFYGFNQYEMVYSDRHHNHWGKIILKLVLFYAFIIVGMGLALRLVLEKRKRAA